LNRLRRLGSERTDQTNDNGKCDNDSYHGDGISDGPLIPSLSGIANAHRGQVTCFPLLTILMLFWGRDATGHRYRQTWESAGVDRAICRLAIPARRCCAGIPCRLTAKQ
jgi:hypothetical protein